MSEVVEEVGGEYGATVRFEVHANGCSVEFFAAEIAARGAMPGDEYQPNYMQKGATGFPCNDAENFKNAERYVEGFVKWDGCSHVRFGEEGLSDQLHLCGRTEFDKLGKILVLIYERCGELMKEAGSNLLEGEFECWKPSEGRNDKSGDTET